MTSIIISLDGHVTYSGNIPIQVDTPPMTVPLDGTYAMCIHDYDRVGVSRPTLNRAPRSIHGLPETVRVMDTNGFVWMTPTIEDAIWNWNKERCPQMVTKQLEASYYSLFTSDRAWTNRYGSDVCANHPLGTNLDKEDKRLFPLLGGGTVIKIKSGLGTNVLTYETMSNTDDFSQYSPTTHPWLFFNPPNSRRDEIWWMKQNHDIIVPTPLDINNPQPGTEWSGKWIEHYVDPFPQYQEHSILPIITRSSHENRISTNLVVILEPGSLWPNPFVPAKFV